MARVAVALCFLLGCVSGGAVEDLPAPRRDASVDAPASDAASDTSEPCDPAADACPPSQHCNPTLKKCVPGCRSDEGCIGGKCDVVNHTCVGCVTNAHCPDGQLCIGGACAPGCDAAKSCPSGLSCCGGGCVDPSSNRDHCGGCGKVCAPTNAVGACSGGDCKVATCKAPFDDCDGDAKNGCETDLSKSATSCGACGKPCAPKNGTGGCESGVCKVTSCASGFGDCNGDPSDGCEASFATDPANCGGCGKKPTESCNLRDDDCNGRCDDLDGCRIGVHRSVGVEHFYTTSASEAACCGFKVEQLNAFYLYSSAAPDTQPFYRCYNAAANRHLYTTSSSCEIWGASASEGVMGHIGSKPLCGAVPLYRLYHGGSNDHLYTTDASERDTALKSGWKDEGTVGYVWKAPKG